MVTWISTPGVRIQSFQPPDPTGPWRRRHQCLEEYPNMVVVGFSYCTLLLLIKASFSNLELMDSNAYCLSIGEANLQSTYSTETSQNHRDVFQLFLWTITKIKVLSMNCK